MKENVDEMIKQIKYDAEHGLFAYWDLPKEYTDEDIRVRAIRFVNGD